MSGAKWHNMAEELGKTFRLLVESRFDFMKLAKKEVSFEYMARYAAQQSANANLWRLIGVAGQNADPEHCEVCKLAHGICHGSLEAMRLEKELPADEEALARRDVKLAENELQFRKSFLRLMELCK